MDQQDILSYGISMTTLEEVFIKANGEEEKDGDKEGVPKIEEDDRISRGSSVNRDDALLASVKSLNKDKQDDFDEKSIDKKDKQLSSENLVGNGSLGESIKALIIKRYNIYKRDRCGLICEVLVPVILVLLGLGLLQIPWIVDSPAFYLSTDAYPGPQRITMNNDNYVQTTDQFTP